MNIPTHEDTNINVLVHQLKYDDTFTMVCWDILNKMILPFLYCGDLELEI